MRRSKKKQQLRGFSIETPFQAALCGAPAGSEPDRCKRALDALARFIEWSRTAPLPAPEPGRALPEILTAMLLAATRRLEFILYAGRKGAMPEVAILLRASIELEASASYLFHSGPDQERLAKRFLAFERVLDARALDFIESAAPEKITPRVKEARDRIEAEIVAFREEFERFTDQYSKPWSGIGHRDMFQKATQHGMDQAPFDAFKTYYPQLCSLAHPTSKGIRGAGHYGLLGSFLKATIFTNVHLYQMSCRSSGIEPEVPRRLFEGVDWPLSKSPEAGLVSQMARSTKGDGPSLSEDSRTKL